VNNVNSEAERSGGQADLDSDLRSATRLRDLKYLLLASDEAAQGAFSGYTQLSKHIPESQLVYETRTDTRSIGERTLVKMLDAFSGSSWYRLASLKLEYRTWQAIQAGFSGLIHLMWAERDWGFIDQLPIHHWNTALCATFHSPPDTLPEVVNAPKRLKNFAALILMSEVQRPFFESLGVPSERIHVVHHGIDCDFFSPSCNDQRGRFTAIFVGNYRRNFELLARICCLLEPYEDIEIRVVAPRSRIAGIAGRKNVRTNSDLSDVDLRDAYRESSCLLLTLETATANNAILEAMACGLPIVTEDVGGVSEYTGPSCAILCQPGSAEEIVGAVLRLYKDDGMRRRMGDAARTRARELSWSIVGTRTVAVYEQVLAKRKHGRG
jgi:glycosyltransferase involved in cell wall biosynthesis